MAVALDALLNRYNTAAQRTHPLARSHLIRAVVKWNPFNRWRQWCMSSGHLTRRWSVEELINRRTRMQSCVWRHDTLIQANWQWYLREGSNCKVGHVWDGHHLRTVISSHAVGEGLNLKYAICGIHIILQHQCIWFESGHREVLLHNHPLPPGRLG